MGKWVVLQQLEMWLIETRGRLPQEGRTWWRGGKEDINWSTFPQLSFYFLDLSIRRTRTIHTWIFWGKLKTVGWTCVTQSSNLTQVSCSLTNCKIPLSKKSMLKNHCFFSRSGNWAARWKDCHSSYKLCHLSRVNYVKNMSSITHHTASFHIDYNDYRLPTISEPYMPKGQELLTNTAKVG